MSAQLPQRWVYVVCVGSGRYDDRDEDAVLVVDGEAEAERVVELLDAQLRVARLHADTPSGETAPFQAYGEPRTAILLLVDDVPVAHHVLQAANGRAWSVRVPVVDAVHLAAQALGARQTVTAEMGQTRRVRREGGAGVRHVLERVVPVPTEEETSR